MLTENNYCQSTINSQVGENNDAIFVPPYIIGTFIRQNLLLPVATPGTDTVLKCSSESVAVPRYTYNQPVVTAPDTVADALFPDGADTKGLYLFGGAKLFNPTVGTATDANGLPYQNSKIMIPFGAKLYSPDMIAYIQANRWNVLRMTADRQTLLIYGGESGFMPGEDDVVELMFSGNNDTAGGGLLTINQKKAGSAVTYVQQGVLATTPANAIAALYDAFKLKCTMPQAV